LNALQSTDAETIPIFASEAWRLLVPAEVRHGGIVVPVRDEDDGPGAGMALNGVASPSWSAG